MTRTTIKFIVAGVVLISAIAYLAFAGSKEGWATYHVTVDAFASDPQVQRQHVRLAGKVASEGIEIGSGRYGAHFTLAGDSSKVNVNYKGVVPELFKADCDVVVEGRLDSANVFQADVLMTKCASKYEVAGASNPHARRAEKE